jgi:crotonobetainyl-CoA:carnitine CoA-transferase CaiB-like acyl-CoA transferase
MPAEGGPLVGVRVLELATLFAVPLMGAILGDLGADVVKVEPPGGDQLRVLGGGEGRPNTWTLASRNKRMITLDTNDPEGIEVLHRLTGCADIVTLNHPLSLLRRLGCTYEEIAARNPRAVVVNGSTFGTSGPYADRPGNGSLAESFGGLTNLIRDRDGNPMLTPALLGDHFTAMAGVAGVLAACYWRDAQGGAGQYVDLTQYESVMFALGPQLVGWTPGGSTPGNRHRTSGLRGTFRTADGGWVTATAYSDAQLSRLLAAVGLTGDASAIAAQTEAWIAGHSQRAVLDAFQAARIQIAPVHDLATLQADPQVQYRGSVVEVADATFGSVLFPRPAPGLSQTPAAIRWANRPLGADTDEVLRDWLGSDQWASGET